MPAIAILGALGVRERSTRAAATRLRCPLAVIAGGADPVTPLDEARSIAEGAANSRFAVLPNGRHDDFHTLGRDEMLAALAWITHAP